MSDQVDVARIEQIIDTRLDALLPRKLAEIARSKTPAMTIIATKGTLDWAYPPFILATTGAALGWNVSVFFTFYGLTLLRKHIDARVSPLGNPAMPMKMPFGSRWFRSIDWKIPNLVQAGVPGFEALATHLMKRTIDRAGVARIGELRALAVEAGVKLIACQMTVELFGMDRSEFIPEVTEFVGAATFLPTALDADVNLFI